jgi:hypothetical protein
MKKLTTLLILITLYSGLQAQKVESIHFNLYTDSLKKGFYNYINIDGKFTDGTWQPLDTSAITFVANTGFFQGNDLFIDSSFTGDKVKVKATLKSNPRMSKEVIIYIRKRGFDEPLKTNDEIIDEMMRSNQRKKRTDRNA